MRDKNLSVECFIDQHRACKKEGCICWCHSLGELLDAAKNLHDSLVNESPVLRVNPSTAHNLIALERAIEKAERMGKPK